MTLISVVRKERPLGSYFVVATSFEIAPFAFKTFCLKNILIISRCEHLSSLTAAFQHLLLFLSHFEGAASDARGILNRESVQKSVGSLLGLARSYR
jgi:hypothetical protein